MKEEKSEAREHEIIEAKPRRAVKIDTEKERILNKIKKQQKKQKKKLGI